MTTVLITRPLHQAKALADDLAHLGYITLLSPMLTIVSLDNPPPTTSTQAVMLTSSNAVEALLTQGHDIPHLLPLPCFCVGTSTADKARTFGFSNVISSESDGLTLAKLISHTLPAPATLLHICAQDVASQGRDALTKNGYSVIAWKIYQAIAAQSLSPATQTALINHAIDAVMVYSARTAQTLNHLLEKPSMDQAYSHVVAIGISPTVTAALSALSWRQIVTAATPTDSAMIAALQNACPSTSDL